MTKLIWMSDLHFAHSGDVLGHDPRIRLQAAVDHINAHHADADLCVISGDMVNRGTSTDYQALRAHLDQLKVPYFPMVGNHDNRALFAGALPLPDERMKDHVQYTVGSDAGLIICLDTLNPGSDGGVLCADRVSWLRETLRAAGKTPAFLFMHHPPMHLGLPMQDTENLENGDAFRKVIAEFDCVKHVFIGHVHRPITGVINGIPFATMRSVLYQAPPPRPDWTWESFSPSAEAPNIGIVELTEAGVTVMYDQFCDYSLGTQ